MSEQLDNDPGCTPCLYLAALLFTLSDKVVLGGNFVSLPKWELQCPISKGNIRFPWFWDGWAWIIGLKPL